jgi:hypothetical protein
MEISQLTSKSQENQRDFREREREREEKRFLTVRKGM